jgi:hypothetical protein
MWVVLHESNKKTQLSTLKTAKKRLTVKHFGAIIVTYSNKRSVKMQALKALFPKTRRNAAATSVIPMYFFVANEAKIRAAAKEYFDRPIRVVFRGPRPYKDATMTRRADATGVLLYMR